MSIVLKNGFNINVVISFILLISTIVFNQFTWSYLFNINSFALWERLTFGIFDILLIVSAIIFYANRKQKNFVFSYLKLISFNSIILIFGLVILELVFGEWFITKNFNQLNIIRDKVITPCRSSFGID